MPTTTEDRVRLPSSALLLAVPHSAARRASADLRAPVQSTVATIDLGYMKSIVPTTRLTVYVRISKTYRHQVVCALYMPLGHRIRLTGPQGNRLHLARP